MKPYLLAACFVASLNGQTVLEVHLYDWAKTPASTMAEAQRGVSRIFRGSGIEVRWFTHGLNEPEASKVVFVNPSPRQGQRQMECAARKDIALSIQADSVLDVKPTALGFANPLAPAGINANIFYSKVVDRAEEYGVPLGELLAHAIAHEIGHVLLRTETHRRHGLMSGNWGDEQFRWIRTARVTFDRGDSRLMQAAITGQGCAEVAAH